MRWIITVFTVFCLAAASAWAQPGYRVGEVQAGEALEENTSEYGQQDVEHLLDALHDAVVLELQERGLFAQAEPAPRIDLILADARPNRPTFRQLTRNPGLSMRSFSRGGAHIEAQIHGVESADPGHFEYDWYTHDIEDAAYRGVWTDAERAIDRFAVRLADHLQDGQD